MTMPKGVTSKELNRTLDWIDLHESEIPKNQRVRKFMLVRGSNKNPKYPPKFVVRKAYSFLNESGWAGIFSGGNETNNFLIRRGFKIWDRDRRKFVGLQAVDEDPDKVFIEGKVLAQFKKHTRIERQGSLPKHAKNLRLKSDPNLRCDVCGFSFAQTYGDIGVGFIEAHHLVPLARLHGERAVQAADLALVCSNCHRMLHRSDPLLKPGRLRELVKSRRNR